MAKPVVLFVSHGATRTGAPLFLGELLTSLAKSGPGFEPIVFVRGEGPLLQDWRATGLSIVLGSKIARNGLAGRLTHRLVALFEYVRVLHKIRPRLVYSNTILNSAEVILARLTGARTLVHVHEGEALMNHHALMMRVSALATSGYLCVSEYSAHALRAATGATGAIVYNGIGAVDARVSAAKIIPASRQVLGMVGGIQPNKGHHITIQALAQLSRDHGRSVYLRIFGDVEDANYRKTLGTLIKSLGMEDRVEFCGTVENRDLIYEGIDVLVVASFDESFGRAILEAFAYAKPVIATEVGGIPEIISDEQNGLLVKPGSPEALAAALHRLVQDPALAMRMVENAKADANKRFRLEDTIAQVRMEIDALLLHT